MTVVNLHSVHADSVRHLTLLAGGDAVDRVVELMQPPTGDNGPALTDVEFGIAMVELALMDDRVQGSAVVQLTGALRSLREAAVKLGGEEVA